MDDLFAKLIKIEERAQEIFKEAVHYEKNLDNEIKEKTAALEEKIKEDTEKKIAGIKQNDKQEVEQKIAQIKQKLEEKLKSLEKEFSENAKNGKMKFFIM